MLGVWIAPVTAQVIITLRLSFVLSPPRLSLPTLCAALPTRCAAALSPRVFSLPTCALSLLGPLHVSVVHIAAVALVVKTLTSDHIGKTLTGDHIGMDVYC